MGLITLKEISEILEKYDIGKEILADIAGFGKVTIKDIMMESFHQENTQIFY